MEASDAFNPYRFGIVAASDTHNSGERFDEDKYVSKVGMLDDEPTERGSVPLANGGFRERTTVSSARRASPARGLPRIRATPSSMRFSARRPSPRPDHA